MHPRGQTVTALIAAGLRIDFVHEHDAVPKRMFANLVERADGLWS